MSTNTTNTCPTSKYAGRTPGPWKARPICEKSKWVDIICLEGGDEKRFYPIVSCKGFDQEANAALVADAPEILAQRDEAMNLLGAVLAAIRFERSQGGFVCISPQWEVIEEDLSAVLAKAGAQ